MRNVNRFGMLALGVGIGAVFGAASAAAAPADDWFRSTDPGPLIPDAAVAADPSESDLNLAVALFGIPVFQQGSAHVYSTFGSGLIAIADGADSIAQTGGFLNTAIALGDGSAAAAAGAGNISIADGDHATAAFGGYLPPIPIGLPVADLTLAFGDNSRAGIVGGSFNSAGVIGHDSTAIAGGTNAIFDAAQVFGNGSTALAGTDPDVGNTGSFDLAAVFGDLLHADATGGIFQIDIAPLF